MAKRRVKQSPKYRTGSLLLLLVACLYFIFFRNEKNTLPENHPTEKTVKKPKAKKELRYLTVFTGKVTGIKDGDTFEVLYEGQPERIRLAGVDCPESSQPFGKAAKQYASQLCFGETVTVVSDGERDRYGRVVGRVITSDSLDVNEEMVRAGLAWHYKAYSDDEGLAMLEAQARELKTGLWSHKKPVAPWEWRKKRRNSRKN